MKGKGASAHLKRVRVGVLVASVAVLVWVTQVILGLASGSSQSYSEQPSPEAQLIQSSAHAPGGIDATLSTRLNLARFQHTSTLLGDGRALVAGGVGQDGKPTASAEIFDPHKNTWHTVASMREARSGHTATPLPDGRVLVTGGLVRSTSADGNARELDTTEFFDPGKNIWVAGPRLHSPRALHTATLLPDGRVLVVGGPINQNGPSSADEISPATNSLVTLGAPPNHVLSGHTATLLNDGTLLIAGGSNGNRPGYLTDAIVFHPSTNSWTVVGSTLAAHSQASASLLRDGRVLIVGGNGSTSDTELFDQISERWTRAGNLSVGRVLHAAAVLPSGQVLVTGGLGEAGRPAEAEIFSPGTERWTSANLATSDKMAQGVVTLNDGRLLVTGGVPAPSSAVKSMPPAPVITAQAGTDDYPSDLKSAAQDSLVDPWGFYNRECTSFAAWRMQRDGHAMSNNMNGGHFGNAGTWYSNAVAIGIPTSTSPTVGAVKQSASTGGVGHVAYTEYATNSTVEDYNYCSAGTYCEHSWTPSDAEYIVFGTVPGAAAVSIHGGTMDVFVKSSGNQIVYQYWNGSAWNGTWVSIGAPSAGILAGTGPAAASMTAGTADVFVVGADRSVYYNYWSEYPVGAWSGWIQVPNSCCAADTPAAASMALGTVDLFVRDQYNRIWYQYWTGSAWNGSWVDLGMPSGGALSAPAAASMTAGELSVYTQGSAGQLMENYWYNSGPWSGWHQVPNSSGLSGAPAAVSMRNSQMDVFGRDAGTAPWYEYWNGSVWSSTLSLGGAFQSPPAAASMDIGQLDVFFVDHSQVSYRYWTDAVGWSTYVAIPQSVP